MVLVGQSEIQAVLLLQAQPPLPALGAAQGGGGLLEAEDYHFPPGAVRWRDRVHQGGGDAQGTPRVFALIFRGTSEDLLSYCFTWVVLHS